MNSRPYLAGTTRRRVVLSGVALCAGCASRVEPPEPALTEWRAVPLPSKRETIYARCEFEGRAAWHARSQADNTAGAAEAWYGDVVLKA